MYFGWSNVINNLKPEHLFFVENGKHQKGNLSPVVAHHWKKFEKDIIKYIDLEILSPVPGLTKSLKPFIELLQAKGYFDYYNNMGYPFGSSW